MVVGYFELINDTAYFIQFNGLTTERNPIGLVLWSKRERNSKQHTLSNTNSQGT